jgi:hypothetical protein
MHVSSQRYIALTLIHLALYLHVHCLPHCVVYAPRFLESKAPAMRALFAS